MKSLINIFCVFFILVFSSCEESILIHLNKAYQLQNQHQFKEAIEVYNIVIKKNKKIQEAYYQRGYCFQQLGKFNDALWNYNMVIVLKGGENSRIEYMPNKTFLNDPENNPEAHTVLFTEVRYQRAITEYSMDSLKKAFIDFRYCIDSYYETGNCHLWVGNIYLAFGKNEKACDSFKKAKLLNDEQADEFIKANCK